MKPKSTSPGVPWKERIKNERRSEYLQETKENWLEITPVGICDEERLLKACASWQEKKSVCHKNGAAFPAHNGDPHPFKQRNEAKFTGPAAFTAPRNRLRAERMWLQTGTQKRPHPLLAARSQG
jgi:hypothetical protein